MIWFEKQTIRFKDWIWAWMNVWWDHLGLNLWEHWPNALEGVWGQIRVGLPRVLTMDLNLRNLWRSSSPWLLDPLLLRQPKGHFVVLERTFTLRTLTFTILMKYWNKHRHISFPITEQGEENKVCGTLFEARKVAGSATNEQSKTWWNCLLSSVCLFSFFITEKKKSINKDFSPLIKMFSHKSTQWNFNNKCNSLVLLHSDQMLPRDNIYGFLCPSLHLISSLKASRPSSSSGDRIINVSNGESC